MEAPRVTLLQGNVAVIRDLNVKFVAAEVVVILGPRCLEAHFAGFWHALQLFNQQGIQEVQLESHLSIANLPLLLLTWIPPKISDLNCSVQQSEASNI